MFKIYSKVSPIKKNLFAAKAEHSCNLRYICQFAALSVGVVFDSTDSTFPDLFRVKDWEPFSFFKMKQKQPFRGSDEKVFGKYAANLQENTHAKVRF